jgi:SpoVK/Ycf46/Vps4 family AAA+-type ATPase
MNSILLKRLFKTISNGNTDDLEKIAYQIINEENKKGHTKLVKELTNIIETTQKNNIGAKESKGKKDSSLVLLPKSKRYEIPLTSFKPFEELEYNMVLQEEIEERFLRIEREYAARERLALYGLLPRKKILLFGPPGCGKTLGAQRLAFNTGLPFLKVNFDAIVSSYLGETATNLRAIFESVSNEPYLLFIDEFDSLAKSRAISQEVGEIKRVVNSFLQLLDDYDAPGLLVAATNLNEQLDPAIWRRFDDVIEMTKPGKSEIKRIIKMTLSSISTTKFNWENVLLEAEGISAAQVVKASREAAKMAILNCTDIVTEELLIMALNENKGGA